MNRYRRRSLLGALAAVVTTGCAGTNDPKTDDDRGTGDPAPTAPEPDPPASADERRGTGLSRMTFHDAGNTRSNPDGPRLTTEPAVAWRTLVAKEQFPSSPIVVGDKVFVTADTALVALDATNGAVLWDTDTDVASDRFTDRPETKPAATSDRVFLADDDTVQAFDSENGDDLWQRDLDAESTTALTIAGGYLYLGHGRELLRLDPATGEGRSVRIGGHVPREPPAVADGRLYLPAGDGVAAVSVPSMVRDWYVSYGADDSEFRWPVAAHGNVYVRSGATTYCLAPDDGSVRWQVESDDGRLAATENAVAVTGNGGLELRDPESGDRRQAIDIPESDVVVGEHVYYSRDYHVEGRSLQSGGSWAVRPRRFEGTVWTLGEAITDVTAAGDYLYFATDVGDVYALGG